ncbi:MAG: hypothetical protein LBH22_02345 [Bacteroidales bacterium]|jgi:hypothetical protein|nr:hypothetical protein [Bacteroidales bacterium]
MSAVRFRLPLKVPWVALGRFYDRIQLGFRASQDIIMYYKRICNIALFVTSIVVFYVWTTIGYLLGNVDEASLYGLSKYSTQLLISFICAYGFFHFFVTLTIKVLEKSVIVKRIVFGSSYLEGTWVGYYFSPPNIPVIFVQKIEQGTDHTHISSDSYHLDLGFRCKWQSISEVSIDIKKSSLLYMYEVESIDKKTRAHGLCVLEFLQKKYSMIRRNPHRLSGYVFNTGTATRINILLVKISDDTCISSEEEQHKLILAALDFYKLDSGFHPLTDYNTQSLEKSSE